MTQEALSSWPSGDGTTAGCGHAIHAQVYDAWPWTRVLYTKWELEFDGIAASAAAGEHYLWLMAVFIPGYLLAIVIGKAIMANRSPFSLKTALIAWNAGLALFSAIGAARLLPHLAMMISHRGLYFAVCAEPKNSYGLGASGLWTFFFIYSKIPELVDTAFIILRKKKLLFLHYYHHCTVLAYCLHSYATTAAPGLWFASLNLFVHAIMYSYYALAAAGHRPSWAIAVTILQIVQMVVGMSLAAAVAYFWSLNKPCHQAPSNMIAGLAMYASYFVLFFIFFLHRYVTGGSSSKEKPSVKPKAE